ncbi:MAG: hypothetical protein J7639_09085 [Paenibacillaceae bacterium]|nr:hypothetical protein [Paenibacillaceae bacterium]
MGARPNFLFLFPDSHRGDWMPYGAAVQQQLGMERLPRGRRRQARFAQSVLHVGGILEQYEE